MNQKPVTRKRLNAAWMELQSVAFNSVLPPKQRSSVRDAMDLIAQIQIEMRRREIFAAGAKARKPSPVFDGKNLGSLETMNFYDGYASTHRNFKNPYRGVL